MWLQINIEYKQSRENIEKFMKKKELLFDNLDSLKRFIVYILNDRISESDVLIMDDKINSIKVKTGKIAELLKIKDNIKDITIFLLFLDLKKPKNVNLKLEQIEKEFGKNINVVIISVSSIESPIKNLEKEKTYGIEFWGEDELKKLVKDNMIYYSNSLDISRLYNNKYVEEIEKKDFDTYIKKTTEHLGSIVAGKKFSLVLGAGVSCSEGALGWKGLIANFESELNSKCKINTDQVLNKIGNSDLISAQLYRELLTESSYYEIIFRSIYNRYKVPDAKYDTLTNCIARLIKECSEARDFRVMTYNYDNYLEQYLDYYCVAYDIMFDMSNIQIGNMPIYHVHGYLPMIDCKENTEQIKFDYSKYKGIYANIIKLTEDDYNTMYNDAYAWQIGTQLSFFRENKCLFIGCSLTDPNIRRLMRMAEKERKKHFAIINKGGMNLIDLVIATNHFSRMGVEVIWTSSHDECKNIIKDLNKLHSKD